MHYMIGGGTGFIGSYLTQHFIAAGHKVTVVGRRESKIRQCFDHQVKALAWSDLSLKDLLDVDAIFMLTGVPLDKRWSIKFKQRCVDARIIPAQKIIALCAQLPVEKQKAMRLFFASAVGFYGFSRNGVHFTEGDQPSINNDLFSVSLVLQMEAVSEPAKALGMHVVNLRFGVVLAKDRGALPSIKLPFLLGLGAYFGDGSQPFSWVHIKDVLHSIDFLLSQPDIQGPVNIVAPNVVSNKVFSKALAKSLHRPCFFRFPAFFLKIILGQMADELLLHGQNVYPAKLLDCKFSFTYDKILQALASFNE